MDFVSNPVTAFPTAITRKMLAVSPVPLKVNVRCLPLRKTMAPSPLTVPLKCVAKQYQPGLLVMFLSRLNSAVVLAYRFVPNLKSQAKARVIFAAKAAPIAGSSVSFCLCWDLRPLIWEIIFRNMRFGRISSCLQTFARNPFVPCRQVISVFYHLINHPKVGLDSGAGGFYIRKCHQHGGV